MTIIYKYTSPSGKVYVGKTERSLKVRRWEHCKDARAGLQRPFLAAVRKYGIDSFQLEVLAEIESDFGNFVEMLFIVALCSADKHIGYNVSDGGEGCLGVRAKPETIQRLREIAKGRVPPPWTEARRLAAHQNMLGNQFGFGYKHTPEQLDHRRRGKC